MTFIAQNSPFAPAFPAQPQAIANPVTGDRMTILYSSLDHDGSYTKIRFDLPPGAEGSPLHYHSSMSETFTVLKGCLDMEVGAKGNRRILQAGEHVHIPAGMPHSFRNSSNEWVTFMSENRPASGFEQFIRGMYGLAIDGKVNAKGMPTNLLHLALLLNKADLVLVGVPPMLQTVVFGVLIQVGNWLGVERSLSKYWNRHP